MTDLNEKNPRQEDEDESWSFMSETVKKRPLRLKKILVRAAGILLSAVLFGAAAALVFLRLISGRVMQPETSQVHIEQDVDSRELASGGFSSDPSSAGTDTSSAESAVSPAETETVSAETVNASTETVTASAGAETSPAAEPSAAPESSPAPASSPAPESSAGAEAAPSAGSGGQPDTDGEGLTEEELRAEAVADYLHLNAAMKELSEEAGRTIVQVTGVTNTEDWFSNKDTALRTTSGLIVAATKKNLLVLTDGDCTDGSERVLATLPDGTIADAALVKKDPVTSLAVIRIPLENIPADSRDSFRVADLGNSYDVRTGDSVIAIGSPLGYSNSVVYGQITSVSSRIQIVDGEFDLMTTSCFGSRDGSGALIDLEGHVVGFIYRRYASEDTSAVTGIPISMLKGLIEKLSNNEAISYIGIMGESVSDEISEGIGVPAGVYVSSVEPDSPALSAGLLPGDVISSFGGQEVRSMAMLHNRMAQTEIGAEVPVTVMRRGADGYVEFEFVITVGEIA
ncbi:MAG: trypsin-like peptidase domain-containing protein [Lachnospiraceae bacterium]|nr:trypsin-like peptidase domain-containing protein [Lachnospiraceae bacterium]